MIMNCDTAQKLLRKLTEDRDRIQSIRNRRSVSIYLVTDPKPEVEFDFIQNQAEDEALVEKIVKLKHALNVFNTTHMVPGTELTIDAALVRLPILSARKRVLAPMADAQKKVQEVNSFAKVSQITEANFEPADAKAAYDKVCEEIMTIQQGLNVVNMTETFEVDIKL